MMMNNAGKAIKQVISNIDRHVIQPAVERLWMWNMRYSDDPDLKGDVKVVAKGANALVVKDVPPGSVVTGIPANMTAGDVIA